MAAFPGFDDRKDPLAKESLEIALGLDEVDAAVVGGADFDQKAAALQRAAISGVATICIHPPGILPDPYYVVELGLHETSAIVVPDIPGRLHPGFAKLRQAIIAARHAHNSGLEVIFEGTFPRGSTNLLHEALPRSVDMVRSLIGEVESVTAFATPPHTTSVSRLGVQLGGKLRGEMRFALGGVRFLRVCVVAPPETLILEFDPDALAPGRLLSKNESGEETELERFEPWNPFATTLEVLETAVQGREHHPNLHDAIRTMELVEAVSGSLRRGRTTQIHYEQVSEAGNFKAVMASLGCWLLFLAMIVLPIALVGPVFGFNGTLVLAYAIPPLLVVFLLLQFLKFLTKGPATRPRPAGSEDEPKVADEIGVSEEREQQLARDPEGSQGR